MAAIADSMAAVCGRMLLSALLSAGVGTVLLASAPRSASSAAELQAPALLAAISVVELLPSMLLPASCGAELLPSVLLPAIAVAEPPPPVPRSASIAKAGLSSSWLLALVGLPSLLLAVSAAAGCSSSRGGVGGRLDASGRLGAGSGADASSSGCWAVSPG